MYAIIAGIPELAASGVYTVPIIPGKAIPAVKRPDIIAILPGLQVFTRDFMKLNLNCCIKEVAVCTIKDIKPTIKPTRPEASQAVRREGDCDAPN